MKNQLEPEASDLLGVPYVKLSRRDELQKGVRLHAEHWKYTDFPKFQPGDIVWTYGSPNAAQIVIRQDGCEVVTVNNEYHLLNVEYFILQPDKVETPVKPTNPQLIKISSGQYNAGEVREATIVGNYSESNEGFLCWSKYKGHFYGNPVEKPEQKKVDFEMLKASIKTLDTFKETFGLKEEIDNLELFFEMMGKSSSFAHLAHNRLKS